MSDSSENQNIQKGEDEYIPEIDDTNYFKEQDEKFEELHKQLQKLKEENKRQIDAIINSLDDLMASKCLIEQTLDKNIPVDDLPIEISNEKLNIVDLLSKVTGIVNDSSIDSSRISENQECAASQDMLQVSKQEHASQPSNKMDCTDDTPKVSELSKETEENPLVNSAKRVLPVNKEEQESQTLNKFDCTDNTGKESKTTEDSPLIGSED